MKKKPIDRKTLLMVDDEPEAVELLKGYAKQRDDLIIVLATSDPEQAMEFVKQEDVDIAIIDLNLRTMWGTELMKAIKGEDTQIIIYTGSDKAGEEVMTAGALDYLLKGAGQERFNLAIDRAIKQLGLIRGNLVSPDYPDIIGLPDACDEDKKVIMIRVENIVYVRADGKETWLFLTDGTVQKVCTMLKDLWPKLDAKRFLRIHRSYIVHMSTTGEYKYVAKDKGYKIVLDEKWKLDWPHKDRDWKLPVGGNEYKRAIEHFIGMDR